MSSTPGRRGALTTPSSAKRQARSPTTSDKATSSSLSSSKLPSKPPLRDGAAKAVPAIRVEPAAGAKSNTKTKAKASLARRRSAPLSPRLTTDAADAKPPAAFLTPQPKRTAAAAERKSMLSDAELRRLDVDDDGGQRICVALRVRPLQPRESAIRASFDADDDGVVSVTAPNKQGVQLSFGPFEKVFNHVDAVDEQATQKELFEALGRPQLDAFLGGQNCTILAFGQTGSGKTFSITGTDDAPGLTPQFCAAIFDQICGEIETGVAELRVALIEIYTEQVFDLLAEDEKRRRSTALRVREDPKRGPYVDGLTEHVVGSLEELQHWARVGLTRRATAATGMNELSSRSHAVFQLRLERTVAAEAAGATRHYRRYSRANLVDLAGSERSATAQEKAGDAADARYKETITINSSLSALRRVISVMASAAKENALTAPPYVPFRDSTLTFLLRQSLGGNARTTLLVTVSPAATHYEESLSTLRFACDASAVVTRPTVNEDASAPLIRRLQVAEAELVRLRGDGGGVEWDRVVAERDSLQHKLDESAAAFERLKAEKQESERLAADERAQLERVRRRLQAVSLAGVEAALRQSPCLVELASDPSLSLVFRLSADSHNQLGRDLSCDFVLGGDMVMPFHCGFALDGGSWKMIPKIEAACHVNGQSLQAPVVLANLDRICLGGERFLLAIVDSNCDETAALKQTYGQARAEYLDAIIPEMEAKAARDAEMRTLEQLSAMRSDYDALAKQHRVETAQLQRRLAEAQQAVQTQACGFEEERAKLLAEKAELEDAGRFLTRFDEQVQATHRRCLELGASPPILTKPSDERRHVNSLRIQVQLANRLLEQLRKRPLFEFVLEEADFTIDGHAEAATIRLCNLKTRISTVLDASELKERVAALRAVLVKAERSDADLEQILYNASDHWQTADGRASDLFTLAVSTPQPSNAICESERPLGRLRSSIARLSAASSGSAGGRRSTISAVLGPFALRRSQTIVADADRCAFNTTAAGDDPFEYPSPIDAQYCIGVAEVVKRGAIPPAFGPLDRFLSSAGNLLADLDDLKAAVAANESNAPRVLQITMTRLCVDVGALAALSHAAAHCIGAQSDNRGSTYAVGRAVLSRAEEAAAEARRHAETLQAELLFWLQCAPDAAKTGAAVESVGRMRGAVERAVESMAELAVLNDDLSAHLSSSVESSLRKKVSPLDGAVTKGRCGGVTKMVAAMSSGLRGAVVKDSLKWLTELEQLLPMVAEATTAPTFHGFVETLVQPFLHALHRHQCARGADGALVAALRRLRRQLETARDELAAVQLLHRPSGHGQLYLWFVAATESVEASAHGFVLI